ncbi:MAG: DUF2304 family protein [Candidatus Beckwithbacteria bacterium]|nr:DUF2304 family protein [Candidatus Beckwithbacteria bacterium]
MSFLPVQIIFSVFLLFAASRVFLRLKDGSLTLASGSFWFGLFIVALLGVFEPELTSIVAKQLGINRGSDAVIYASIILLFYLIFRTNVLLENLRHDLTKLVRMIALNQEKKK